MNPVDIFCQSGFDLGKLATLLRQFPGKSKLPAVVMGLVGCEPAARVGKSLAMPFLLKLKAVDGMLQA